MSHGLKLPFAALAANAFLICAPAVLAQGQSQNQNQQNQNQQSQQQSQQQTAAPEQTQRPSLKNPLQDVFPPSKAPAVDPKEEAAYEAFVQIQPGSANDDAEIKAGEDFVKNYPQSRYREAVYSRLANAYLDKNDTDKMCDAAEKALALNPNDVTVLIPVGEAIPRSNPAASNFAQRLATAEQYEKHAIGVLNAMTKPPSLTDEQFNQTRSDAAAEAHSGLGLVYFDEKKYDLSSAELQSATAGSPDLQATNQFVLGLDFVNLRRYPDAVKAFDTCSQISSSLQNRCKKASAETKVREGAAARH